MLVPREADLPVLILILVVLPLVTYILLGIWGETSKRKARISMLAQLAAEEALRVNEAPPVVFTPHFMPHFTLNVPRSKISSYECAKCFAPATTRCSKCKSVRYCSGKCQIMHWRQGHKQECHQLAIMRSLSTSADSIQSRDHVENSKQVLQNVIDEPRNSDFLSDLASDGSLATSNIAYDTASEKRLSSSEKRVSRKQRRVTLTSNNLACALENAGTNDVDKPTLLGNKLGSGSFTSSVEVNDHAPTALTNVKHQHHKIMGEARTPHKPRFTRDNVENVVNECETSTNLISGGRFSSSNEALDSNSMAEDASISGSIVYKRPPYILGSTPSLSQKSAEKILCDESRVSASSACKSVQLQNSSGVSSSDGSNMSGSRKSSKVHKWDILGLMNDGSKNKMLFPYEDLVKFFQCEVWGISPRGLLNCGNSCYANAVLQCLTCTKPLMIYLLRRSHSKSCRIRDWCLMCELEEHASMLREGGGGPLSPSRVLSNMRNIGCRMGGGNQEDAHEFLRLLVMSMQSICLAGLGGEKEVDPKLQETTLIQQIFGGRLKSKVKCLRCHLESERYENIMDLTLEIHGWVESLEDALTQFTAPEDLGFVFGNSGNVSTSFGSEFMTNEGTKSNMCSIPSCPAPSFQSFGSTFTFTGKPGGSETPQMEFKTPKQEPARLTKESLFTGTNQNISFSVKKCDAKSTRTKKKKGLSRQSASVHQVFPKQFVNVENETNENPEVGSDGAYSPMDYSPYREDSVANHCSREPSVASVDSILFGSNDANDDGKRNSSADSVYADEQISEFEKDSDVSKYENVGLDSNVRVAPMEPETRFFSSNPERQGTEGGGGFTFSSSLEDLGESKFTFSTSMFNQSKVSASQHSYRRRSRSKSAQNSSVSTPNARVPLTSPLPDLIPQMSTSGLLDLLRQKSTSSIPQSADESKTGESRESRVTKEPTGSTTANISAQEACEKWRYRGNQAYADGNLSKAEDYYSRGINSVSLKDIPGSCIQPLTLCYSNRAATRMSLGRMREALSDCKMAVSIDPEFLKARVRVGNCHLALGEIGEALEQFKECLLSDKDVRTNKKYLNEASDGLQKAQQVADLTGQAAELLLKRTSDGASKALSEICKALLISPYSENLLEMKAEALIMMRNYDEVIKLCEQTLDLAEQNSILNEDSQFRTEYMKVSAAKLWRWHLISKSYFCLGKLEDALELIQKTEEVKVAVDKISYKNQSVESSTSFAITIRKLLSLKSAGNEAFQAGKHLEAVECYSAALSCNAESRPFTAICFCNRAAAYQALGQMTDAIADCSLAVALDPSYLKAISRRATLHEMIRDYGQASNDLNRLVSLLEKQMEVNRPGAVGRSANTASDLNKARLRLAKVEEEARKGVSLNMYMILGVEPSSSAADVKKAYRKAALRHHPDKAGQFLVKNDNVDDGLWKEVAAEVHTDADRLFKMIGEAYTILSDPTKRQQYDDEEEMRTVPRKDNYGSTTPKTSSYTYSSYYEKNVNRPQWQAHGSSYQRW